MGTTNPGFDTEDMEELALRQEIAFLKEEIASIQAPAKVKTLYKKLFQKRRKIKDLERENSELWVKVNLREGRRDLIKETEVIESDTSTKSSNEDSDKNSQPDENVNSEDVLEENSVVGDLVLKLDDARRGNNSLREEINVKYNELQKLADEIQTYKEQYERLQNDINGRKAEQGRTIQENDIEEQKETSDQGFDEEFAHKTSKNDNELTDKPVNSAATKVWSRSQMKLEKLQAKYGELDNALRSKVQERDPLRSELSACKDALKSTKFELSASKAHVNDLEGELAALQRQFDDMKDKCQKETARNEQIKDELDWYKLQKEQQSRIQKSQGKSDDIISDLEAKLKESHSVLDEMKARLLDMQLQKMNEKLNENGTEVSNDQAEKEDQSDFQIRHWTDTDIKSTVYTPEKAGFEEKKIDEDSDEEFANICTIAEENKKLQASIESYQQNIHLLHEDYKTKMSALENNVNRKHSLEKHTLECSLNGKEHMLRKLKKERDEFEESFVKEADDRVRKIEEQKKRCLEEIEYLKDTLENRNEEVERLERKLHEKESALENTKTAQEEAEDALSDSKREGNKYKHEVDMLQEDMNNLTRKYTQAMQFLENIELKRIAVENSYKSQVKDATPAKGNQTVSFSKNIDVINVNRYSYYSSVSFTEEEEVEERSAELSEITDNPVPFHEQPAIAEEPKIPVVEESIVDDSVSEQYQASDDVANLPPGNSKTEYQKPRKKVKLRRSGATTESDRPFMSRSSRPKSTSSIDETMSPTVVDSYQSSLQWVSEEIKQLETNGTDNKSRIDMLKEKEKQILKLIEEVQQGDKTDLESWLEKVKFFENECKRTDRSLTSTLRPLRRSTSEMDVRNDIIKFLTRILNGDSELEFDPTTGELDEKSVLFFQNWLENTIERLAGFRIMSKNNTNNEATNSQQTTPITFIEYPANTKPHEETLSPFETLEEQYLVEGELESSLVEDWMAKNDSAENTDAVDYGDMSAEFDKAFGGIDDFNSEDDDVLTEIKTKEIGEWVEIDAVKSPKPKRRGMDLSRKTPLERRANFSGESEATFSLDEAQLSSGNDTETIEALLQDATSDESDDTRLKEDLRKLKQAVEEHKAEIEGLKARQDDYTREIQLLTGEIEAKRKIIAILSIEKESMCKTITDLQYENDQLTVRLADESEKKVTMEKQHANCLERLLEKEQEIRQLRRQLESMEKKRKLFSFRRKKKGPLERATSTMSLDP